MEDIKSLIYADLDTLLPNLDDVQGLKSFVSTDRAIDDIEKLVFRDAAIALGDSMFELEVYGIAWDKIRHGVQLLYFIKSAKGLEKSISNLNLIVANLRQNNFDKTSLLNGKLQISYEFRNITDKISYALLEYSIVEIQYR